MESTAFFGKITVAIDKLEQTAFNLSKSLMTMINQVQKKEKCSRKAPFSLYEVCSRLCSKVSEKSKA